MPDATVPEGPLLVVSPHLDDAALSCAALLEREEPVTVFDVFTLVPEPERSTEWDRRCGFAGSTEAMGAREAEEAAAFAGADHEVLAVDLLEGQYRDHPRGLRDEWRLTNALNGWIDRYDTCTVALPVGAGLTVGTSSSLWSRLWAVVRGRRLLYVDPDHLWVRDTALTVVRGRRGVSVLLYEEYPHRWSRTGKPMVGLVERWLDATAEPLVLPVDRTRKAERLTAYRSQIPVLFRRGGGRGLARRLQSDEHYWALRFSVTAVGCGDSSTEDARQVRR